MPETVTFDVGGKYYRVSTSLMQQYPDCMLTRMVSKEWKKEEDTKLFIERDGERFRYVLDYFRDGSVSIPCTVPKAALLKDMEYYGLQVNDNIVTDDSKKQLWFLFDKWVSLENKSLYFKFVKECMDEIFTTKRMCFTLDCNQNNAWREIFELPGHEESLNKIFSDYGLKIAEFKYLDKWVERAGCPRRQIATVAAILELEKSCLEYCVKLQRMEGI